MPVKTSMAGSKWQPPACSGDGVVVVVGVVAGVVVVEVVVVVT